MKTMNDGAAAAKDDARPTRDDLARYARVYRLSTEHAQMPRNGRPRWPMRSCSTMTVITRTRAMPA